MVDRWRPPHSDPKSRRDRPSPPRRIFLHRALSKLGVASRTEAWHLVESGRVSVRGVVVRDPERLVPETGAALELDGMPLLRAPTVLLAPNKPRGTVTTLRDPEGRPTVYECLEGVGTRVLAVGRLDQASSGLLLFTNDNRFSAWLTDPCNAIVRRYVVTARGDVTEEKLALLRRGVVDDGEVLRPSSVILRKRSRRESTLLFELTTGKNREIRRLLAAVGHEVTRLSRIAYGGLELGTLAPGSWRTIGPAERTTAFPDWPSEVAAEE